MGRPEAKVITVSDTSFAGSRADATGPRLAEYLERSGFSVRAVTVIPDGVEEVAAALRLATDAFTGLVITNGGTGFGLRDLTPEGTAAVLEREAPGLAEATRATSPLGRLSRGRAGIVGRCVILNVPGSPAGAEESLAAVIDVLPHALDLLAGESGPHPTAQAISSGSVHEHREDRAPTGASRRTPGAR
jgi:molybdenum cofactor synthesis domain-containing protein